MCNNMFDVGRRNGELLAPDRHGQSGLSYPGGLCVPEPKVEEA